MNKIQSKIKKYPDGGGLKPKPASNKDKLRGSISNSEGVPEEFKGSWVDKLKGEFNTAALPLYREIYKDQLKKELAKTESGSEKDPYKAVNPDTGALGKYQFLPEVLTKDWKIKDHNKFLNNPQLQEDLMEKQSYYLFNRANALAKLHGLQLDDNLINLAKGVHFKGNDGLYDELTGKSSLNKSTDINPSTNEYINRSKKEYGGGINDLSNKVGAAGQGIQVADAVYKGQDAIVNSISDPNGDTKLNPVNALSYASQGVLGLPKMIGYINDIKQNQTNQKNAEVSKHKSIINSYIEPNVGEGLPGFKSGGQLPNFPMDKMLIAMESGGNINPQYIMKDGGGFHLNPAHKGWCTPMTKATCTGKRRTFALNAKHHFKKWKHEDGGDINNVKNNDLITYNGASHEEGGININQAGIPNNTNPKAEVEGGESGVGSYIFSDTIGVDKSGNPTLRQPVKTFSDMAKKIDKRYKGKEDRLAQATKKFEYSNLKTKNDEALEMKVQQGFERFKKKYGGMVKMRYGGADESPTPYFNPNVADGLNLPPQRTPSWWNIPANMEGSISNPANLPNVNVNGIPNIPGNNIPYLDNPRVGKNYNLPPNSTQLPIDNTNSSKTSPVGGTDAYPYIQGYDYTKQPGWGTNPQVTPEIPLDVMFGQEPKNYKTEPPVDKKNPDYLGLGLSTIAPAINFAYGMKKDDNKYYANEKYGQAKNYLNQLPTDINIDANLAANTRDFKAASSDVNRRTPSVGNAVTSQLLSNKLNANNTLYQSKYNAENQLKSGKLSALSQLDYTAGETDRNQRIALEDKNLANKARREDLQLNAIKDASSNLNIMRNDKVGINSINEILKYSTWDSNTNSFIPKKGLNAADMYTFNWLNSQIKKKSE